MIKKFSFAMFFYLSILFSHQAWGVSSYVVNNTGDGSDTQNVDPTCEVNLGGGDCTLRAAIEQVQANLAFGSTDSYTITFDESLKGQTICIGSSLTINAAVTLSIEGDSLIPIILDGGNSSIGSSACSSSAITDSIFKIGGSGPTVTLKNLMIKGGKASTQGGGIYVVDSNLTIDGIQVSENQVGEPSLLEKAYGGGIYIEISGAYIVTVKNSSFVSNKANGEVGIYGGGIYAYLSGAGTISFTHVTVSNNIINEQGASYAYGAGFFLQDLTGGTSAGIISISHSTIASNQIINSSVAGSYSGGGIAAFSNSSGVLIRNSIIANNSVSATGTESYGPDCYSEAGGSGLKDLGYNLIENTSNCDVLYYTDAGEEGEGFNSTDITGEDPKIDSFGHNGGIGKTHALQSESPAINSGICTDHDGNIILTDQRGKPRNDGFCDIGAYEYQSSTTGSSTSGESSSTDSTTTSGDGFTSDTSSTTSGSTSGESSSTDSTTTSGDGSDAGIEDSGGEDTNDDGIPDSQEEQSEENSDEQDNSENNTKSDDDGQNVDASGGCSCSLTNHSSPAPSFLTLLVILVVIGVMRSIIKKDFGCDFILLK